MGDDARRHPYDGQREMKRKSPPVTLRYLDLDETLVSSPSRIHLSILENAMLWPNDDRARDEAEQSALAFQGREIMRMGGLDQVLVAQLVELAVDARPLPQIQDLAKTPFRHGELAGMIL